MRNYAREVQVHRHRRSRYRSCESYDERYPSGHHSKRRMKQPAQIEVLAARTRKVRANLAVAQRTAQSDYAAEQPREQDVSAARAHLNHEAGGGEDSRTNHAGDYNRGRRD